MKPAYSLFIFFTSIIFITQVFAAKDEEFCRRILAGFVGSKDEKLFVELRQLMHSQEGLIKIETHFDELQSANHIPDIHGFPDLYGYENFFEKGSLQEKYRDVILFLYFLNLKKLVSESENGFFTLRSLSLRGKWRELIQYLSSQVLDSDFHIGGIASVRDFIQATAVYIAISAKPKAEHHPFRHRDPGMTKNERITKTRELWSIYRDTYEGLCDIYFNHLESLIENRFLTEDYEIYSYRPQLRSVFIYFLQKSSGQKYLTRDQFKNDAMQEIIYTLLMIKLATDPKISADVREFADNWLSKLFEEEQQDKRLIAFLRRLVNSLGHEF